MKSKKRFLKSFYKNKYFYITILIIILIALVFVTMRPYQYRNFGLTSKIKDPLRVFYYNQSIHTNDPVTQCWYDGGDYLVFLHRNIETLYYLSFAYMYAEDRRVQKDLLNTIEGQLGCVDAMLEGNWKQFRDQDAHIGILPPIVNKLLAPQEFYPLKEHEGGDVYTLRALIAKNIGKEKRYSAFLAFAQERGITTSDNCCEEGLVGMDNEDFINIQVLAGLKNIEVQDDSAGWGISYENIRLLEEEKFDNIEKVLKGVQDNWDKQALDFDYIGGNYDIAGTIALERLYAKKSGDDKFIGLSNSMMSYLHGSNAYNVDFSAYTDIHHPCGQWWARCNLDETLINGIDERRNFDTHRKDIWRLTEMQLKGQAEYILALVLFYNY